MSPETPMSPDETPAREAMEFDVVIVGAGPAGLAASEGRFDAGGAAQGIATGDMGIAKDGRRKQSFARGMELRAKYTLFAEGARGSLGKILLARFGLEQGREPQKFGIGLKELWQV